MNILKISGIVFLAIGLLLFIPTWGGSILFIGIAVIFFSTQYILKHKSNKLFNRIGIVYLTILGILYYNYSRTIVFEVSGEPSKIYVMTGIENKPSIHSYWKLFNRIKVDSTYIVMTSSNDNQVGENFEVIDENENNIGSRGHGRRYGLCENESSLISVQTIHLDFYEKFNQKKFDKEIVIQNMLIKLCENR